MAVPTRRLVRASGARLACPRTGAPILLVGVLGLAAVMADRFSRVETQGDDAYITYVYAQSLAAGHGFRFNVEAPQVLGTTTPLYTAVLALGARLGMDIPTLSMLIGALCMCLGAGLLLLLGAEIGSTVVATVAALAWTLNPAVWWAAQGMEAPLYVVLILAAFLAAQRGWRTAACTAAGLCVLTRPDGLAVLAAVGAHLALGRCWSWRAFLPAAVLLGGWCLLAWLWFGSPLPTSGTAKVLHEAAISGHFSVLSPNLLRLVFPLSWLAEVTNNAAATGWVALVVLLFECCAIGAVYVFRYSPIGRMLLIWVTLYVAGYTLLGLPDFGWYYLPLGTLGCLLFWSGAHHLLVSVPRRLGPRWTAVGNGLVVVLGVSMAGVVLLAASIGAAGAHADPHQLAGEWLRAHAPPGATVAAYEVGKLRYFSGVSTIDILGLTEPEAQPFLERHDYAWAVRLRPDFVFTNDPPGTWPVTVAIANEPIFGAEYLPVARFADRPGRDYVLFGRRPA